MLVVGGPQRLHVRGHVQRREPATVVGVDHLEVRDVVAQVVRAVGRPRRVERIERLPDRLWHAATHVGDEPRYCLITSWTSGPELDAYIEKYHGVNKVDSVEVPQDVLEAGYAEQARKDAARAAYYAAKGQVEVQAMSEA